MITQCIEETGITADQENALRSTCHTAADGGTPVGDSGVSVSNVQTFSEGPCSRTNALAGCQITSGGFSTTIWYYMGGIQTLDTIRAGCTSGNGTLVMP